MRPCFCLKNGEYARWSYHLIHVLSFVQFIYFKSSQFVVLIYNIDNNIYWIRSLAICIDNSCLEKGIHRLAVRVKGKEPTFKTVLKVFQVE
jgi:hypothetical protein